MSVPQLAPLQQDLVQETLLGEALEHGPVGAIVLDEEGRYLAANRLACKLSGYTRDELLAGGATALAVDRARLETTMDLMARGDLHSGTAMLKRAMALALDEIFPFAVNGVTMALQKSIQNGCWWPRRRRQCEGR